MISGGINSAGHSRKVAPAHCKQYMSLIVYRHFCAPRAIVSQRAALENLRLEKPPVVCLGKADYALAEKIEVTDLARLAG